MDEWEIGLENLCSDVVSQREYEPLVAKLLCGKSAEWWRLSDIAGLAGLGLTHVGDLASDLHVVWLRHPRDHESYAVIVFYDLDSKWTKGFDYNRKRLVFDSEKSDSDHDG